MFVMIIGSLSLLSAREAAAKEKSSPATKAAKVAAKTEKTNRVLAGVLSRRTAAVGSSNELEIRGQTRTLSMMLTLRNGQDGINFIQVRKDFRPEIQNTGF